MPHRKPVITGALGLGTKGKLHTGEQHLNLGEVTLLVGGFRLFKNCIKCTKVKLNKAWISKGFRKVKTHRLQSYQDIFPVFCFVLFFLNNTFWCGIYISSQRNIRHSSFTVVLGDYLSWKRN